MKRIINPFALWLFCLLTRFVYADENGALRYFKERELTYPLAFAEMPDNVCRVPLSDINLSSENSGYKIAADDNVKRFYAHIKKQYTFEKCKLFNDTAAAFIFAKPILYEDSDSKYYGIRIDAVVPISSTVSTIPFTKIDAYGIGLQSNIALFSTEPDFRFLGWIF